MTSMGRRRWLGVLVLTAALAMLIMGETVLRGRLQDLSFLAYWLVCLALTGLAILVALSDARALRRRTRRETHELLQTTLNQIAIDTRLKPAPNSQAKGTNSSAGNGSESTVHSPRSTIDPS